MELGLSFQAFARIASVVPFFYQQVSLTVVFFEIGIFFFKNQINK